MAEKRYTKNGEWAQKVGDRYRVGLAASTAEELGDVTFVEAPEAGRRVAAGAAACALEAVKAAADFYSPLAGRIAETNPALVARPSLVSESPEAEGWILALDEVNEADFAALWDEAAWKAWESGR